MTEIVICPDGHADRGTEPATLKATFHGTGRRPKCAPNPAYPGGMVTNLAADHPGCWADLTYPAPSVGKWLIECPRCGYTALVTAASRPDDPKAVRVPCQMKGSA